MSIKNVDFMYPQNGGENNRIFSNFSMEFPKSKVSVILGPSGCGKTTLLNLISGLLAAEGGTISCCSSSEAVCNISVLFQEPRLLPWRSVRQNIELVLNKHYGPEKSRETAAHYLDLVGLADFMDYYPQSLSGGMRQRAAMARAFAYPAETILMDEPFQALDLGLKINLTSLFARLWVEDRRTSIFVTHDINEAILLGDEIFVLSAGRPVKIIEHISNAVPHKERMLDSPESLSIEKKLYRLMS
ncbi:MAG: ABC transporter ATP-binding protein [Spirochaetales bacterium]|nr:ABC transporter ATP-binding protein [Spirochaetales bacterium]